MASSLKATAQAFDAATISEVDGGGVYVLAAEKPSDPGQYAILYVGQASDLKSRLQEHLNARSVAGVTHFFAEPIANEVARADREKDLIRHFMPIGNTLAELPRASATEAAYLAVRALWHRRLLATGHLSITEMANVDRLPETVRLAAIHLLEAIAEAEGKPLELLDANTAARYLNLLYDTIRNRSAADLGYDLGQGQRLLSQLRGG